MWSGGFGDPAECWVPATVLGHEVIDVSGLIDEAVVDVLTNAVLNV